MNFGQHRRGHYSNRSWVTVPARQRRDQFIPPSIRALKADSKPPPPVAYKARLLSCGWVPLSYFSLQASVWNLKRGDWLLCMCKKRMELETFRLMAIRRDPNDGWQVRPADETQRRRYRLSMVKSVARKKKEKAA